jgi:hypothetical protein
MSKSFGGGGSSSGASRVSNVSSAAKSAASNMSRSFGTGGGGGDKSKGFSGIGAAAQAAGSNLTRSYNNAGGQNRNSIGNLPSLSRSIFGGVNPGQSMLNGYNNAGYNALSRANAYGLATMPAQRPPGHSLSFLSNHTPYGSPQVMGSGYNSLSAYALNEAAKPIGPKDQSRVGVPQSPAPAAPAAPPSFMDQMAINRRKEDLAEYGRRFSMIDAPPGLPKQYADRIAPEQQTPGIGRIAGDPRVSYTPIGSMQAPAPQNVAGNPNPFRQSPMSLAGDVRRQAALAQGPAPAVRQPTNIGEIRPDPRMNPAPQIMRQAAGTMTGPYNPSPRPSGEYSGYGAPDSPETQMANMQGLVNSGALNPGSGERILSVENYDDGQFAQPSTGDNIRPSVAPSQNAGVPQDFAELGNRYDYTKGQIKQGIGNIFDTITNGNVRGDVRPPGMGGDDGTRGQQQQDAIIDTVADLLGKGQPITPEVLASLPPQIADYIRRMFPQLITAAPAQNASVAENWSFPGYTQNWLAPPPPASPIIPSAPFTRTA